MLRILYCTAGGKASRSFEVSSWVRLRGLSRPTEMVRDMRGMRGKGLWEQQIPPVRSHGTPGQAG
jgi:hypothetical protein